MKNKLIFIILCVVIVMALCACKPLNISSDSNGSNGTTDGAVNVVFRIEDSNNALSKAITISNPLFNDDVKFQFKAISSNKEAVGSTNGEWVDLSSIGLGEEFNKKFSVGQWTFDVQGIDKKDSSVLFKTAKPIDINIFSKFKDSVVFYVEGTADIGDGEGTIQFDLIVQGYSDRGQLDVFVKPVNSDLEGQDFEFKDIKIDGYKTYFNGDKNKFNLMSGIYDMKFVYHNQELKTPMGPYTVTVATDKETTVSGVVAHESEFVTYFNTPNNNYKYRATFIGTAEEHNYGYHQKQIDPGVIVRIDEERIEVQKKISKIETDKIEKVDEINKFDPDEKYIILIVTRISETETIKDDFKEVDLAVKEAKEVKEFKEAKKAAVKKIGFINYLVDTDNKVICNLDESYFIENYTDGNGYNTVYAIPQKLFGTSGQLGNNEQVVKIKCDVTTSGDPIVATSEEIVLSYINY